MRLGGVCSEGPQTHPDLPAVSAENSVVMDSGPDSEARSTSSRGSTCQGRRHGLDH